MNEETKKVFLERIQYLIEDTGQLYEALDTLKVSPEFKILTHNYHVVCMKALLEMENAE